MDLNDVQSAYNQLKSNRKALTKLIEVLHSLLLSHSALKLKALYKTLDIRKNPPPVTGDLAFNSDDIEEARHPSLESNPQLHRGKNPYVKAQYHETNNSQ